VLRYFFDVSNHIIIKKIGKSLLLKVFDKLDAVEVPGGT
jgi:hypothetical protein